MPRKSTELPEPEPTPTRRSTRVSVAPQAFDEDATPSAVKKTTRGRKKTEESESLPKIDEASSVLEPVTPKRGRRKSRKVEDLLDDDDEENQPEQVQGDKENIAPKTPEQTKQATPAKVVTPV
jgi:hypothetical protein